MLCSDFASEMTSQLSGRCGTWPVHDLSLTARYSWSTVYLACDCTHLWDVSGVAPRLVGVADKMRMAPGVGGFDFGLPQERQRRRGRAPEIAEGDSESRL